MEHRISDIQIPTFDLTGKVAVVTGGTKGIGYGIALTLAHYGADVVVASRSEKDCQRVAGELASFGHEALGIPTDVRRPEQSDALMEQVVKRFGKVDIMVCNAGMGATVDAVDMTEQQWDDVQDTDLKGVFFSARAAARKMIAGKTGGKVIAISSAAAFSGARGISHYCAAKAGVVNLMRALAVEWARYGITANAVCPGYVPTSINEPERATPGVQEKLEKHTLVRRLGSIDEIAVAVLMLASPSSGYITGTSILIDGGAAAR